MSYRIRRHEQPLTLDFSEDDTTIVSDAIENLNGLLCGLIVVVPALEGSDTAAISIKDADGYEIFAKTGLAESTTHPLFIDSNNHPLRRPMSGNHTITIVTSGAQTADRVFNVVLHIDRGA